MGRWINFSNGVVYKFSSEQESGFDFLDGIVEYHTEVYYVVIGEISDYETDDPEFAEWSYDNLIEDQFLMSEVRHLPGWKEEWFEHMTHHDSENSFILTYIFKPALLGFIEAIGSEFQIPKFQEYEMSSRGTLKLWNDICSHFENTKYDTTIPEIRKADFSLACVIYHMSLWDSNLGGTYEA